MTSTLKPLSVQQLAATLLFQRSGHQKKMDLLQAHGHGGWELSKNTAISGGLLHSRLRKDLRAGVPVPEWFTVDFLLALRLSAKDARRWLLEQARTTPHGIHARGAVRLLGCLWRDNFHTAQLVRSLPFKTERFRDHPVNHYAENEIGHLFCDVDGVIIDVTADYYPKMATVEARLDPGDAVIWQGRRPVSIEEARKATGDWPDASIHITQDDVDFAMRFKKRSKKP